MVTIEHLTVSAVVSQSEHCGGGCIIYKYMSRASWVIHTLILLVDPSVPVVSGQIVTR